MRSLVDVGWIKAKSSVFRHVGTLQTVSFNKSDRSLSSHFSTWIRAHLSRIHITTALCHRYVYIYNPQPLSSGAAGEADIVPVVATCQLFLTVTEKLDKKTKKNAFDERKTGLFALI